MNIKVTVLAIILAIGFPLTAQAQETNSLETNSARDLQVSCQPGAECNNFGVNVQDPGVNVQEQDDELAQTRRTRTRRTRGYTTLDSKYYAGGNVGLFLPLIDDSDLGFDFGGLFGYKVNKNISAEAEVFNARGGTELDDLGYSILGFTANGVYRYYFNPDSSKSLYAFGGLGLGYGKLSATGDVADRRDDRGLDTSDSGFLLQTKAGVGYPITDKIDAFGQARYANVFIDGEDGNGISFDVGATYNF